MLSQYLCHEQLRPRVSHRNIVAYSWRDFNLNGGNILFFAKFFRKQPKTGTAAMDTATAAWKSTIHI
jgi:hypothetical protein